MNQKQSKYRFFIDLAGVSHWHSHSGIIMTSLL
jgi:hypothetical protein